MKRLFVLLVATLVLSLASTSTTFAQLVAEQWYSAIGRNQHQPPDTFSIPPGGDDYTARVASVGMAYGRTHVSDGIHQYQVTADWTDRVACITAPFSGASATGVMNTYGSIEPQGGVAHCSVWGSRGGMAPICDGAYLMTKIGINPDRPWDPIGPIQSSEEMAKKIVRLLSQQ
jgi:hypothetical protein